MSQTSLKQTAVRLVLLSALGAPLMAQHLAAAQDAPGRSRPSAKAVSTKPGNGGMGFLSQLQRRVGLSPKQMDTVRGLQARQSQELKAIRAETEPRIKAVRERTNAEIRATLSPEQQPKFDAYIAEREATRKARNRNRAS